MKAQGITTGQRIFADGLNQALMRAWLDRFALTVEVDPRGGTSVAEMRDINGKVVWRQTAEGVQPELPFGASPAVLSEAPPPPPPPSSSGAPDDTSPSLGFTVDLGREPGKMTAEAWARSVELHKTPLGLHFWHFMGSGSASCVHTSVPSALAAAFHEVLRAKGFEATTVPSQNEPMWIGPGRRFGDEGDDFEVLSIDALNGRVTCSIAGREEPFVLNEREIGIECDSQGPHVVLWPAAEAPAVKRRREKIGMADRGVVFVTRDSDVMLVTGKVKELNPEKGGIGGVMGGDCRPWHLHGPVDPRKAALVTAIRAGLTKLKVDHHVRGVDEPTTIAETEAWLRDQGLLEEGAPKPTKPAKGKGAHRHERVPKADALARHGVEVCVVQHKGTEAWVVLAARTTETSLVWKRLVVDGAKHGRIRLYNRAPRCVWDSADGGAP